MSQANLYVSFGGRQVAVSSNAPEVLAGIRPGFRDMLTSEITNPAGKLVVQSKGSHYYMMEVEGADSKYGHLPYILECVSYEVVLLLIKAHPDLLWFHAGAAAYQDSAVVLMGRSGRGKSTLVTKLYSKGLTYLSDDILPLEPSSGVVSPFPRSPSVRENIGREVSSDCLHELRKVDVDVKRERVCKAPKRISALIFPIFRLSSPTEMLPCSPGDAALEMLQNCLNFICHREAAVGYICDLVKGLPAFRLYFNDADAAAELIIYAYENMRPA